MITATKKTTDLRILLSLLTLHINNCTAQVNSTQKTQSISACARATAETQYQQHVTLSNITVTAYCLCFKCCPKSSKGITASGQKPIEGVTVAASRSIPLGTRIAIDGRTYIVQDRLAKKYDSRVDIYFNKHQDAKNFGKQTKQVTIYAH
jgi:3D (Asp-Asp-Asp) domain-containing protein